MSVTNPDSVARTSGCMSARVLFRGDKEDNSHVVWFSTESEFKRFLEAKSVGAKTFKGTFFYMDMDRVMGIIAHPKDVKVR